MSLKPSTVASLFIVGTFFHAASAAIDIYQGVDGTATDKSQLVNSAAAQASFASAVGGGLVVEPLESAPIGLHQATWSVGGLHYARFLGDDSGILNAANKGRFATSGNVFAYTNGNGSFFTFNGNVDAFGAYFTDVGDYGDPMVMRFNDGSDQQIELPKTSSGNSGAMFFGFTDFGASISTIEILGSPYDYWGFDDVQWRTVPEPATLLLLTAATLVPYRVRRTTALPR